MSTHSHSMLDSAGWPRRGEAGPAVVALGGGHGLSATLRALRHVTHRLTAVVTVADDGGSSGRLRREFDCLPPGDLRMALAALTDDSEWGLTWRDVLQHRFAGEASWTTTPWATCSSSRCGSCSATRWRASTGSGDSWRSMGEWFP